MCIMPSDTVDQHVYSCNLVIEFNICISDILNQYVLLEKANTSNLKSGLMSCEYIDRPCSGLIIRLDVYPITSHVYIVKLDLQGYTYFSIFPVKHRFCVLFRTASLRRF